MDKGIFRYWGKYDKNSQKHHLLVYHLLDVASVGLTALEQFPKWHHFFANQFGLTLEQTRNFICWLLALHDIGKFSSIFQQKVDSLSHLLPETQFANVATHSHSDLGWIAWNNILSPLDENIEDFTDLAFTFLNIKLEHDQKEILDSFLRASTGHHGKPPRESSHGTWNNYFSSQNKKDLTEYIQWVNHFFKIEQLPFFNSPQAITNKTLLISTSWWLAGFIVFCDWIGSDETQFKYFSEPIDLESYWHKIALPSAKSAILNTGMQVCDSSSSLDISELFTYIKLPTPLQKQINEHQISKKPSLYILEDVMGAGKTEAALTLAQHIISSGLSNGLYFGLPTMATADAMFDRVEVVYKHLFDKSSNPNIVLAHSARALNSKFLASISENPNSSQYGNSSKEEFTATAECSKWLSDSRKKSLLADVGVGTIDQVLLSILPSKHQSLRLLGLYNKVLLLDEVHASDAYQHGLTKRLLEFHASTGGSVILVSATLPNSTRHELIAAFKKGLGTTWNQEKDLSSEYPLLTCVNDSTLSEFKIDPNPNSVRKVTVHLIDTESDILEYVLEKSQSHCVVWIRNTVNDAITTYHELTEKIGTENVILFHARFALGDRWKIQKDTVDRFGKTSGATKRRGKIVIATQVIENSLDVDFDFMVTDLAPIDLVIQRMGRLQRHSRDKDGNHSTSEKRQAPELILFSPSPIWECTADWVKKLLPGTARVYEDHGKLWKTAHWFYKHTIFHIPSQLRDAVEYVYSESDDEIPESLKKNLNTAIAKEMTKEYEALQASIRLKNGYSISETFWENDVIAVTRLGEPMIKIRLAKWDDEKLSPWILNHDEKLAWQMSEVQVHQSKICAEWNYKDKKLMQAIANLKSKWPQKGEYETVIPLQLKEGMWSGFAKNKTHEPIKVRYSEITGLEYEK